jgi:two-component system, cell cycle sensor histidine kinase and response regulator CckA
VIHDPHFHASLLDQVHNAVIATDPEGRIVYWNRAAETVYQWNAAEVLGRNIAEVTVPAESVGDAGRIMEALARDGHWAGEFRVRRKDGSTFPAFVSDSVLRGPDGAAQGMIGITADLTALKAAEEKYRRVVDTAAEGICLIDSAGRVEMVNRPMAAMLGYTEDVGLLDLRELVMEEDRASLEGLFERNPRGGPRDTELRLRRRDGSPVVTRISSSPRDEGGALWMVTDLSDRVAGEERLRRLADANIIGVLTADPERILDANAVFLDMVGHTRAELERGAVRWPEMTPREYAELDGRALEDLLATGSCRPFEKEFYRKDGGRVPVLIGAALLNHKPEWLCFVLDLTERKRAEEALRAVRHMESIGYLAGGVAHNLNNLLVSVIGNASLLSDSPALAAAERSLAEDIMTSGERAAQLTGQLLAYAGKGGFVVGPTAVSLVISRLAMVVRASVQKGVDVRFHLAHDLPPIEADEGQIRQLVTELVLNAAEAIDGSGGAIDVSTRLVEVQPNRRPVTAIGELRPGRYIAIEVVDTGAGIDERARARLFDPFFTTKFTGRGLGLAAVAGIVRSHRGAIEVASELGKGSRFRVYLPV